MLRVCMSDVQGVGGGGIYSDAGSSEQLCCRLRHRRFTTHIWRFPHLKFSCNLWSLFSLVVWALLCPRYCSVSPGLLAIKQCILGSIIKVDGRLGLAIPIQSLLIIIFRGTLLVEEYSDLDTHGISLILFYISCCSIGRADGIKGGRDLADFVLSPSIYVLCFLPVLFFCKYFWLFE